MVRRISRYKSFVTVQSQIIASQSVVSLEETAPKVTRRADKT